MTNRAFKLPGLLFLAAAALLIGAARAAPAERDRPFDADWRFLRGDAPGAEAPGFDDAAWGALDLPHDWSIEDLPPSEKPSVPELVLAAGSWRFRKGDDAAWSAREFDDGAWTLVAVPDTWERQSDHTADNVYGWFRRRLDIPAECRGRDFDLLLGRIDDADETWLNGVRIGGTGSFPPDFRSAWSESRRYRVPALLVRGDGTDVLAVRVFDGSGNGGIYEVGGTIRVGPFDTALTQGGPATGHVVGGTGWYRKHFTLTPGDAGKRVVVRFEGVYMNSDVWINGYHAGAHPYGYTPFEFDLTPHLKPAGQPNVLAVRVRNEGKTSRWYSGSGIYRHCWLTVTDPVHVPSGGLFVTTPEVGAEKAVVKISGEVRNDGGAEAELEFRARILDARGRTLSRLSIPVRVTAGATKVVERSVELSSPRLWSPEDPALHRVEVELVADGKTLDRVATRFGIRKIEIDAEQGFRLNGRPLKLKGGCVHHDNGPLGAVAIGRAEERRVELLKANGFNSIRTAHNPPSTAFLEACDRLGVLVIDEAFDCWSVGKTEHDYSVYFNEWAARDIAAMVRRDRNHPSVMMWSIGNEIPDQFRAETTQKMLRDAVLAHDPTRAINQAICGDGGAVSRDWDGLSDVAFRHLDVGGYNYRPYKYESDHARNPARVIVGTESYPKDLYEYWSLVEKHPYVIGDFVWTAMDYFGESGVGHAVPSTLPQSILMPWPWYNAWCGDLDVCGFKKSQSYYRDVVWRRSLVEMAVRVPMPEDVVERVSAWGWPSEMRSWSWAGHEGRTMRVVVYSRADLVRLELNGRTLGEKPVSGDSKLTVTFDVPYAPGELRAIGLVDGKPAGEVVLRSTGAPAALRLTADRAKIRADRDDLSFVTVEIVDEEGRVVPDARVPVRFAVSGAGELAATGSAAPDDAASFRAPLRTTHQGRCLVILRPTSTAAGKITLRAEADGLRPATVSVQAR